VGRGLVKGGIGPYVYFVVVAILVGTCAVVAISFKDNAFFLGVSAGLGVTLIGNLVTNLANHFVLGYDPMADSIVDKINVLDGHLTA
jgi:hypothetical protein